MTDTMAAPHHPMANKGGAGSFTDCKVPGLAAYLLMHMDGGRKGKLQTRKGQSEVR